MRNRFNLITHLSVCCLLSVGSFALAEDVLPSWNDGPARQSIIEFVRRVTTPGGADFVPVADRIAVFDCDGTLMSEQPMYIQLAFALERVDELAAQDPNFKKTPLLEAVLNRQQDPDTVTNMLRTDYKEQLEGTKTDGNLLELLRVTHSGMTIAEFESTVRKWLATARHPILRRPYTELVFQPMLEVQTYLRTHGFRTYIVSGSGTAYLRTWTEAAFGIPPEQVIGSTISAEFVHEEGQPPTLIRGEEFYFTDGGHKVVGIQGHIGRRPTMAFGNSDGDFAMLDWTTSGEGLRFGLIVHHTDAAREFAYDKDSAFGRLDKALAAAPDRGWTVVDMQRDWKRIFPFENTSVAMREDILSQPVYRSVGTQTVVNSSQMFSNGDPCCRCCVPARRSRMRY